MLCSRFLRQVERRHRRESLLLRGYLRSLGWVLRHRALTVAAAMTVTAGSVFLYLDMPKGFMPTQDTGVIYVRTVTTSNVSFTAMTALQRAVSAAILDDPAVDGLNSYIGTDNGSVLSNGEMLVALKPPAVRQMTIQQVIARLRDSLAKVQGVRTFFTPIQDLALGVQSSASRYQYTLTASDPDHLGAMGRQDASGDGRSEGNADRRHQQQRDRRPAGWPRDRPGARCGHGRDAAGGGQHAVRCVRPAADPHDLPAAQLLARGAGGRARRCRPILPRSTRCSCPAPAAGRCRWRP